MPSPQVKAKRKGYDAEVGALKALFSALPRLVRRGSVGYYKGAADLEQHGYKPSLNLVVTKAFRTDFLVTMSADDFNRLAADHLRDRKVRVQVKYRRDMWLHKVMKELRESE